jgi:hypothetical protein
MIAYEIYSFDEINGYELMGILPERRRSPKRITMESVLKWGRMISSNNTDGKKIFFECITIDDVSGEILEVNLPFNDY